MTIHRMLMAAGIVLAGVSTAAGQTAIGASSSASNSLARRVDSLFLREIRRDGPGCAVGVYKDGKPVLSRGYGLASVEDRRPITARTTFNLGSASKPFTALAALMLEQRGKLSLDDDVRRYVPELPDYGTPIRVRDLIQHTSGLRDYGALETLGGKSVATMAEFIGLLASQRALNFTPGTQHEYSHSDYLVLGLVVERASGSVFGDHLAREVLRPMGMSGSAVHDAPASMIEARAFGHTVSSNGVRIRFPDDQTFGGTNLYTSVEDLAHWDRNLEEGRVGGRQLIARMLDRPSLPSGTRIPYAFGLRLGSYRGLRSVSRGGHPGGTRSEIIRFPTERFGVAVLCNADHLEASQFAHRVADIYLDGKMQPARSRPNPPSIVLVDSTDLKRYAGVYRPVEQPWNLLPIELRNGDLVEVLFDDVRGDTLFTMTPAGKDRFFEIGTTGNVGIFTFRSSADGAPTRLEVSWNDGPAEVLDRVPDSLVWRPSAAALAEYGGVWFSPELDVSWRFETRRDRLVLRRTGQHDLELRPVQRDQFVRGFGSWLSTLAAHLQFHRDSGGKITHLTVSTPPGEDSARGVRFVRVPPQ